MYDFIPSVVTHLVALVNCIFSQFMFRFFELPSRSNYKWFKIDKNLKGDDQHDELPGPVYNPRIEDLQEQTGMVENEPIPLPLALRMLQQQ